MDNYSTCTDTINFLKDIDVDVIYRKANTSPQVSKQYNTDVYDMLPDKFILTDPDLEFNVALPNNFVEILSNLSDKYNSYKIGFALDISDFDKMYPGKYFLDYNIYNWENNYWQKRITDQEYELYTADIDTTFALINKKNIHNIKIRVTGNLLAKHLPWYIDNKINIQIRVAGNFLAKHLPWYIDNKINNLYETYILYQQQTKISTIKNMIINFIEQNYNKVYKNNEMFLIEKQNPYIDFWTNNYMSWKNEAFDIFDKYMDKNKIFIDVGASTGETSLYASRKSKHVYSIEADKQIFNNLTTNMKNNCCNNFTLINKNITDKIDNILVDYHINENEISLINIDIKGEEEDILFDLYNIHKKYNIPLYIYFYYDKWKDKNLDRFYFLDDKQKETIRTHSYKSILFSNRIIECFENCNKNWLNSNIVTVLLMKK
jgi:hypothetical protein